MNNNLVSRFLEEHNYDVRVSGNGRWIDQKCAFDAVCFVADCIMDYIQNGGSQPFQSPNIWKSEYAITNVQNIFCKPDPLRRTTLDEYNKFFRQPMKMLAAAGVLREDGIVRNTIQFSVANMDILQYIALRERNAFDFLCLYIEKTLKDSGLWDSFETFFDEQTNDSLQTLKDTFANFCIKYTPINTPVEASRIFTKVLNPLACKYHKKGTAKGKLSPSMITYDKIISTRPIGVMMRPAKIKMWHGEILFLSLRPMMNISTVYPGLLSICVSSTTNITMGNPRFWIGSLLAKKLPICTIFFPSTATRRLQSIWRI